jgi:hypothetical protein
MFRVSQLQYKAVNSKLGTSSNTVAGLVGGAKADTDGLKWGTTGWIRK